MTRNRFQDMSNDTLVERFADLALGQDEAELIPISANTTVCSGK